MPSAASRLFALAACLVAASCASLRPSRFAPLGELHSHRVPFEMGQVKSTGGNMITIREVWGTRPAIEVGGSYIVKGTYRLTDADSGELTFWETADGWHNAGPNIDTQVMKVRRGEGEFVLLHEMPGPGYFHVAMHVGTGKTRRTVADVYFGHGKSLLVSKETGDILNGDVVRVEDSADGFRPLNNPGISVNPPTTAYEITCLIRALEERVRAIEKGDGDD